MNDTRAPKGRLRLYDSYNFVDKDPVIDVARSMLKREGTTIAEAARTSQVSYTTLRGWFDGKTRRPQYCTVLALFRSHGYRQAFIKRGKK